MSLVKQANDIVDVVGSYLALRPAGGTHKGLCPFHDDSRPSFDVDGRRQRYRCWSCGKYGDVLSFVQEFEKISFREALELLAKRAGIDLGPQSPANQGRAQLIDTLRWAAKQYAECLIDGAEASAARAYVAERRLRGETVRQWGLGFAPANGHWLLERAERDRVPLEHLVTVGLVGLRSSGDGYYDRFRDRVQFPIRDARGQVVGFGGRLLPGSPLAERAPKYYNSADSTLFNKSEQLYGIDLARTPAEKAGYLAIVEGYTDVLMAHQCGVPQVVATMGTALNVKHLQQIKRFVPRVVLVYDADEGGDKGVDRALELFVSHDMELAVAALPAGMDPCDLLVKDGPGPFRRALEAATDALEFKLARATGREDTTSIEGRRRVVDAVLGVIALASPQAGQSGAVKVQLMLGRVAKRLGLSDETLWSRLDELRRDKRRGEEKPASPRSAPAAPEERQLLEVLLADATLVARAAAEVRPEDVAHPGLRLLLAGLYALHADGAVPSLDRLRERLDNPPLLAKAFELQHVGMEHPDRAASLADVLSHFRERRERSVRRELADRLHAVEDHAQALELLRRLQNRPDESGPAEGAA
ncbi:MAG: DNA primase [Gemmataceae bacterium]